MYILDPDWQQRHFAISRIKNFYRQLYDSHLSNTSVNVLLLANTFVTKHFLNENVWGRLKLLLK